MWPDAKIQASSDDGGVLRQTPTCSTGREFPCARPIFADPSGSDSDVPSVSRGRFAALSDDMTLLVERCPGNVDTCSRVAIPNGEENRTRLLRMSQATTVAVPPESLDVTVHSDREVPAPRRPSRRLVLVGANHDERPVEACSVSDNDSVMLSGDIVEVFVCGEEKPEELLITAEVPPVCPSAAHQRGGFAQL